MDSMMAIIIIIIIVIAGAMLITITIITVIIVHPPSSSSSSSSRHGADTADDVAAAAAPFGIFHQESSAQSLHLVHDVRGDVPLFVPFRFGELTLAIVDDGAEPLIARMAVCLIDLFD